MRARTRITAAFAATALVVGLLAGTTPPVGAADASTTVAYFYDPAYTDACAPADPVNCTADGVFEFLEDLGVQINLIEDITASDFTGALADANVLVFPELDNVPFIADLPQASADAIADFVDSGGRATFMGVDQDTVMNDLFGYALANLGGLACVINPCTETSETAGTEFEGLGPLENFTATDALVSNSLPSGAFDLFEDVADPGNTPVAVLPFGDGSVVFLGWNWTDGPPAGIDGGDWPEVFDAAITPLVPEFGESVTGATGQTLVCPLTLGPGSQAVTLSWEGVFDSDGETFTGELVLEPNSEGGIEGITTRPEGDTATVTLTVLSPFGQPENDNCSFAWTGAQATPLAPVTPAVPAAPVTVTPSLTG